ncbi:MAG: hypothetical protein QG642_646 [Patescibacteria group bacterium]|nr:hypothetical protein [Patescibacteria group bacterium]
MKKIWTMLTVLALAITSLSFVNQAQATGYTLSQVQGHNTSADCWVIVNNKVYNLTNYITQHPGGASAVTNLCGTNGTAAFTGQHSGSTSANNTLTAYYIGDLIISDTTAPSTPGNLNATVISPSQINLGWSASTDNIAVTGYAIFRNNTEIATTTSNSFINTGLTASTTYAYAVKAYDAAGNRSASSTTISASTLATSSDSTAPSTPLNLTASVISASQINLNWSTSTDNTAVTGYAVFRNNVEIANVTSNSYQNTGLTASTTYSYTIKAYDAAGNRSAHSNLVSATSLGSVTGTDTVAPSAPSKLKAEKKSYQHIKLEWKKSKDNVKVTGYAIFQNGVQIATVKNKDHYTVNRLTANTSYTFSVRAFDAAGNMSAESNIITISTKNQKPEARHEDRDDDDDDCEINKSKNYKSKNLINSLEKNLKKLSEKKSNNKNKD